MDRRLSARYVWYKWLMVAMNLIRRLVVVDPKKRLTVSEALHHPWISQQRQELETLYHQQVTPLMPQESNDD